MVGFLEGIVGRSFLIVAVDGHELQDMISFGDYHIYIIKFLYIYDNDIVFSNEVALKKDLAKRLGGATKAFSKDLEAKETGHGASLS